MDLSELSNAASKLAITKNKKKASRHKKCSFQKCHQTLNTTELLEAILVQLPIKDLLFAQLVCSTWKNCIEASPRLQQGLFFQLPEGDPTTDLASILLSAPWALLEDDGDTKDIRNTIVNPLLTKVFEKDELAFCHFLNWSSPTATDFQPPQPDTLEMHPSIQRPEASWRRMHLCYPKVIKINIHRDSEPFFGQLFWEHMHAMPDLIPPRQWMTEFWITSLGSGFTIPEKFTRDRGVKMIRFMLPTMRGAMGELIGLMHACENTAESESFMVTSQGEEVKDEDAWEDEEDDEEGCGPQ
ncbi:hypothetical protein AC578_2173 [Pseudocercospora eumusae]|uniref:F-box domain-containing protein n=1 Tax=Pseudocercospora eumusae TaxID=321146 RepID=A0A139HHB7_9PEZI|nr:hypothetical protein AC578_2173 [Pseudocercospora eumusae]